MDEATAAGRRFSVARILVEVDLRHKLQERVWVGDDEEGFWQPIEYENLPLFCSYCRHLGHSATDCHGQESSKQIAVVAMTSVVEPKSTLPIQKAASAPKQKWVEVQERRENSSGARITEQMRHNVGATGDSLDKRKEISEDVVRATREPLKSGKTVIAVDTGNPGLRNDIIEQPRQSETTPTTGGSKATSEVQKTEDAVATNTSEEEKPFEKVLRLSRPDFDPIRGYSDCSEDSEWEENRQYSYGGGGGFLSDHDNLGMERGRGFKMRGSKKKIRFRP